eukprot:287616-Pleurochrysis_carterae.AAC.2
MPKHTKARGSARKFIKENTEGAGCIQGSSRHIACRCVTKLRDEFSAKFGTSALKFSAEHSRNGHRVSQSDVNGALTSRRDPKPLRLSPQGQLLRLGRGFGGVRAHAES